MQFVEQCPTEDALANRLANADGTHKDWKAVKKSSELQLPKGYLDALVAQVGKSRNELLSTRVDNDVDNDSVSWFQVTQNLPAPANPRGQEPKPAHMLYTRSRIRRRVATAKSKDEIDAVARADTDTLAPHHRCVSASMPGTSSRATLLRLSPRHPAGREARWAT